MQLINLIFIVFLAARNNFTRIDSAWSGVVSSWINDVLAATRRHSLLSITDKFVSGLLVVCCVNCTGLLVHEVLLRSRFVDCANVSPAVVNLLVVIFWFVFWLLDYHRGIYLSPKLINLSHFWKRPLIALGLILVGHSQSLSCWVHTLVNCVVYNHAQYLTWCATSCSWPLWGVIATLNNLLDLLVLTRSVSIVLDCFLLIWMVDSIKVCLADLRCLSNTVIHISLNR